MATTALKQEDIHISELEKKHVELFGGYVSTTKRGDAGMSQRGEFEIFSMYKPVRTVYSASLGR